MGKVISGASVSLDGFVAFEDDTIGDLFDWYQAGDMEVEDAGGLELGTVRLGDPVSCIPAARVTHLRFAVERTRS